MATSSHLSFLYDRLASRLAISKTKLLSQPAILPKRTPIKDDDSSSFRRLHVGQFSKLGGGLDALKLNFPTVRTNICTADRTDTEEGIIMESLSVEQSAQKDHGANQA